MRTKDLLEPDIFVCKTVRKNGISLFRQFIIGNVGVVDIVVCHVNKHIKSCKKVLRSLS